MGDEEQPAAPEWMAQLIAGLQNNRGDRKLPTPKYDGTTDVTRFLTTFQEVSDANEWDDEARAIRLKLALQGTAADLVQGDDYETLAESLLTRFEMTREEARRELKSLRLKPGQDIHVFGDRVMKLVRLSDPEQNAEARDEFATRELVEAITDRHLTREFRVLQPINFADAIRRIQQYNSDMGVAKIRAVGADEDEEMKKMTERCNRLEASVGTMEKTVVNLAASIGDVISSKLTEVMEAMRLDSRNSGEQTRRTRDIKTVQCYNCRGFGHFANNCPQPKRSRQDPVKDQGPK